MGRHRSVVVALVALLGACAGVEACCQSVPSRRLGRGKIVCVCVCPTPAVDELTMGKGEGAVRTSHRPPPIRKTELISILFVRFGQIYRSGSILPLAFGDTAAAAPAMDTRMLERSGSSCPSGGGREARGGRRRGLLRPTGPIRRCPAARAKQQTQQQQQQQQQQWWW
jgi:hypothetical protein